MTKIIDTQLDHNVYTFCRAAYPARYYWRAYEVHTTNTARLISQTQQKMLLLMRAESRSGSWFTDHSVATSETDIREELLATTMDTIVGDTQVHLEGDWERFWRNLNRFKHEWGKLNITYAVIAQLRPILIVPKQIKIEQFTVKPQRLFDLIDQIQKTDKQMRSLPKIACQTLSRQENAKKKLSGEW